MPSIVQVPLNNFSLTQHHVFASPTTVLHSKFRPKVRRSAQKRQRKTLSSSPSCLLSGLFKSKLLIRSSTKASNLGVSKDIERSTALEAKPSSTASESATTQGYEEHSSYNSSRKWKLAPYPYVHLDPLMLFSSSDTYLNLDPLGLFTPFIFSATFQTNSLEERAEEDATSPAGEDERTTSSTRASTTNDLEDRENQEQKRKWKLATYPFVHLDPLSVFSSQDTYLNLDPLGVFTPFIFGHHFQNSTLSSILHQSEGDASKPHLSEVGRQVLSRAHKIQDELSSLHPLELPSISDLPIPSFAPSPRTSPSMHPPRQRRNKYLSGNFMPIHQEHAQETPCTVLGRIPRELRGSFFRNGPNPQFIPPPGGYHWFDGDGMVHRVKFHDGGVAYSSRWVRTESFQEEAAAGHILYPGLSQISLSPQPMRLMVATALGLRTRDVPTWCGAKNPGNNHLIWHAGRLLALWEAGYPYRLEQESLETQGVETFGGVLNSGFTAHPKIDPRSGHMMFYGYNLIKKPYLHYGVVNAKGDIVHQADIDLDVPVFMHDFAITENYTIFLDFPLDFDLNRLIQSKGAVKPFFFNPNRRARIGLLPRFGNNSNIQWFPVQPGFVLHAMNAYEEREREGSPAVTVVLQGNLFRSFTALNLADIDPWLASDEICHLHEWRLHLPSGTATERQLSHFCSDFLTIHPSHTGVKNRYGYSSRFLNQPGPGNTAPLFDAFLKHDFDKGTIAVHEFGVGRFGGEAVFVPRSAGSDSSISVPRRGFPNFLPGNGWLGRKEEESEDDGWLLVHVWDEEREQSELVVVDAKNFEGPPVARVMMPARVPYGFHGLFVPDQQHGKERGMVKARDSGEGRE